MSKNDITLPVGDGFVNIRVSAIIKRDNMILLSGSPKVDYMYTVGGRMQFGETAEEAVIREVYEETGVKMEVDRLGFVHENLFIADAATSKQGKLIYEISFFFYMKTPENFEPEAYSFEDGGADNFLKWVDIDSDMKYFPEFFREELKEPVEYVKYIKTDERLK